VEIENQDQKTHFRGTGFRQKKEKSSQTRIFGTKNAESMYAVRICPGVTFGNEQRVPREKNKCTSEKSGEVVRRVVNDLSHGQKSKRYSQGKIDQTTPRLRRRKSRRGRKILKSR
jgi:hypothetical protein